uniref:Uncharacterized protein n=1 Tax=Stomoxys calcitrans TaxID=35570 RepID=A0A1I8NQK6_STOCA
MEALDCRLPRQRTLKCQICARDFHNAEMWSYCWLFMVTTRRFQLFKFIELIADVDQPTIAKNNKYNNPLNGNSNPKIVVSTSTANITLCDSLNNSNSNISNHNNNNNNNHITIDNLEQQQQQQQLLHHTTIPIQPLSESTTIAAATIFADSDNNSLSTATATSTNYIAIPLSERPPIICIAQEQHNHHQQQQQQQQQHDNYSQSLTRSASCLLRFRRCCIKFFSKIMGSNNPSEADRFEYYDCKYKTIKYE